MKEPVVRFSKGGEEVLLDRQTSRKPVVRTAFGTVKKRISGRI